MKLDLHVTLDLPNGWEFEGLWTDTYEKDETKRWSAGAYLSTNGHRHDISVEGSGPTPQAAVEALPAAIEKLLNTLFPSRD